MVKPNGSFSYDDNFNYIGERWTAIEQTGTKGYEPGYGRLGRRPFCLFEMGLWEGTDPLEDQLTRADTLLFLASRLAVDKGYCRKTDLVHNFLLRSRLAVSAFLVFISDGDVMNAWTLARVLIERCVWLGYILKTDRVEEFYEYSAFEVKKWAYKAASLGIIDREAIDEFDEEMEDELGHRLGKPSPQWDKLGVEEMCKQAFDLPFSNRIYALYQLASMSTHPGMDDSGEYFKVAAVIGTGDRGPSYEMIQISSEIFGTLIALAEPPVIEAATEAYGEERVSGIMQLKGMPALIELVWQGSQHLGRQQI